MPREFPPCPATAGPRVRFDDAGHWLTVDRGPVAVACNLGKQREPVPLGGRGLRVRLASDMRVELVSGAVDLSPESVAVLVADVAPEEDQHEDTAW